MRVVFAFLICSLAVPAYSWAQLSTHESHARFVDGARRAVLVNEDCARSMCAQDQLVTSQKPAHRFTDSLNVSLWAAASAALLADGATTQHLLTKYPGATYEADPFAKPFVDNGWPGQILGGLLFMAADVGLQYLLHRKGHHRAERWIAAIPITYGTVSAVHNFRLIRDISRQRRR
jgi:hypothetical protein